MAAVVTTPQLEANYDKFIAELTKLSRKYGVAIQSVGGVILADAPGEFRDVTYRADISSGDLYPVWIPCHTFPRQNSPRRSLACGTRPHQSSP